MSAPRVASGLTPEAQAELCSSLQARFVPRGKEALGHQIMAKVVGFTPHAPDRYSCCYPASWGEILSRGQEELAALVAVRSGSERGLNAVVLGVARRAKPESAFQARIAEIALEVFPRMTRWDDIRLLDTLVSAAGPALTAAAVRDRVHDASQINALTEVALVTRRMDTVAVLAPLTEPYLREYCLALSCECNSEVLFNQLFEAGIGNLRALETAICCRRESFLQRLLEESPLTPEVRHDLAVLALSLGHEPEARRVLDGPLGGGALGQSALKSAIQHNCAAGMRVVLPVLGERVDVARMVLFAVRSATMNRLERGLCRLSRELPPAEQANGLVEYLEVNRRSTLAGMALREGAALGIESLQELLAQRGCTAAICARGFAQAVQAGRMGAADCLFSPARGVLPPLLRTAYPLAQAGDLDGLRPLLVDLRENPRWALAVLKAAAVRGHVNLLNELLENQRMMTAGNLVRLTLLDLPPESVRAITRLALRQIVPRIAAFQCCLGACLAIRKGQRETAHVYLDAILSAGEETMLPTGDLYKQHCLSQCLGEVAAYGDLALAQRILGDLNLSWLIRSDPVFFPLKIEVAVRFQQGDIATYFRRTMRTPLSGGAAAAAGAGGSR